MKAAPRQWWTFDGKLLAPLTGIFIALLVPSFFLAEGPAALPAGADAVEGILINEAAMWSMALALLAIVVFWERRKLSSIGLVRPTWEAFVASAAVMALLITVALGSAAAIKAAGFPIDDDNQARLVIGLPIWLQIIVVLSAGTTEEILFRGYPIERITELTGRRWLGALVPVFVFGAVHAPFWGVAHAVVAGVQGLLLTIVYLWRRNLWTNISAHALLDGFVFVVLDIATSHGTVNP